MISDYSIGNEGQLLIKTPDINEWSIFDINRQDFGISYAGKVDDLIRDEVVIKLNLISQAQ